MSETSIRLREKSLQDSFEAGYLPGLFCLSVTSGVLVFKPVLRDFLKIAVIEKFQINDKQTFAPARVNSHCADISDLGGANSNEGSLSP